MVESVKVILSTMSSKTGEKFSHKPGRIRTKVINHKGERINFSFLHRKKITKPYKESFKEHAAKSIGKRYQRNIVN